ncbi:zinc transporter ZIP1-like [Mytilus trossulus]|uniref:zinc transporter ZIP1-like n=1 Tax=Mytilus trossulus TaxID=6551 RepID=UPI003006E044
MEVKIVKVFILFGLLLISFVLGFIPIKWIWHFKEKTREKSRTFHLVISCLSCFASGVFLATCLLHLLVDTRLKQDNTTLGRPSAGQNKMSPAEMHASQTDNSVFRSILLILALSLHSIFEGLAVGLQTETSSILKIFTGLVIHTGVISFTPPHYLFRCRILEGLVCGTFLYVMFFEML